jgi:hypothetical protein
MPGGRSAHYFQETIGFQRGSADQGTIDVWTREQRLRVVGFHASAVQNPGLCG